MQCSPTCPPSPSWVENGIFQHNVISLHLPAHPFREEHGIFQHLPANLPLGREWYLPTQCHIPSATCPPPSGKRMVSSGQHVISLHLPAHLPLGREWYLPTQPHIPSPTCPPPSGKRMVSSNTMSYPVTYLPTPLWEENGIFQHDVISRHLLPPY